MKQKSLFISVLIGLTLFATGCSTTARFKLPSSSSRLIVHERQVVPNADGSVKTSPFFWNTAGGIAYEVQDASGKTVRSGKLKSRFRVASIFWPPFALIYWPMGFGSDQYDLTRPGDGIFVRDVQNHVMADPAPAAAPVKTKKTK